MSDIKEASPKQLKWLRDLLDGRNYADFPEPWRVWCDTIKGQFSECDSPESLNAYLINNGRIPVSHEDFQRALVRLQAAPQHKTVKDVIEARPSSMELEDGVYKVGNTIYKVKHAKTGNQWAHRLEFVNEQPNKGGMLAATFEFAGKPKTLGIRPDHKLTYEAAKEFGALYGVCCCCGRLLTNELSIHLGIGPVCGGREFGGEFKTLLAEAKLAVGSNEDES